MDNLQAYYANRAAEYERIYAKPERQADLAALRSRIPALFAGRSVLEVACGTGYWTEVIAPHVRSITAIDFAEETLAIARSKKYPANRVEFAQGDAYGLPDFGRRHDALFGGFWWSHVPLARLDSFLAGVDKVVAPGSIVAFLENRYVKGSSTPISRRDAEGNTYQTRKLDNGTAHEVLKNFPTEPELIERASVHGHEARVEWLEYYWLLAYRTKSDA
ncbi:MAG TPA: class I SAM-dependent methyltransferase [Burkholderiales bacterium]|jgi:demethylmenaquinone methyltransferase/2-methoxy-6-polyprenyl-1,4-benzoquinol methylase|nr:class I SAM-dependent methyltransferase [Burkholderiales bacterium]